MVVSFFGVVNVKQEVLLQMRRLGGGRIINVASIGVPSVCKC